MEDDDDHLDEEEDGREEGQVLSGPHGLQGGIISDEDDSDDESRFDGGETTESNVPNNSTNDHPVNLSTNESVNGRLENNQHPPEAGHPPVAAPNDDSRAAGAASLMMMMHPGAVQHSDVSAMGFAPPTHQQQPLQYAEHGQVFQYPSAYADTSSSSFQQPHPAAFWNHTTNYPPQLAYFPPPPPGMAPAGLYAQPSSPPMAPPFVATQAYPPPPQANTTTFAPQPPHPHHTPGATAGTGNAQAFAAGAAWAAAQIAQAAADYANSGGFAHATGPARPPPQAAAQPFTAPWYPYPAQPSPTPTQQQQHGPSADHHPTEQLWDDAATASSLSSVVMLEQPPQEQQQQQQQYRTETHPPERRRRSGFGRSRDGAPDPADSEADLTEPIANNRESGNHRDEDPHDYPPSHFRDTSRHRRKRQQRLPPPNEEDNDDNQEGYSQHHSRGRRPSGRSSRSGSTPKQQEQPAPPQREKIRRRLRSDGESSSSGSSFYPPHHSSMESPYYHCPSTSRRHYKKKKARSDESLLGKTAVSALYEWCSKRDRKPIFMEQGKPTFVASYVGNPLENTTVPSPPEEFDFTVALNDEEDVALGRGSGTTKSAAKQMAARRALQSLVPGVVFDSTTGILVELPNFNREDYASRHHQPLKWALQEHPHHEATTTSVRKTDSEVAADELAPNLAKRLAIGRDSHHHQSHSEEKHGASVATSTEGGDSILAISFSQRASLVGGSTSAAYASLRVNPDDQPHPLKPASSAVMKKRDDPSGPSIKRSLDIATSCGQSTTTSGEDEDGNTYYTGRGASVCSALLHAMVQIDSRIPEAPQYNFQVVDQTLPNIRRRVDPISESHTAIRVHRGPFSCVARLKVKKAKGSLLEIKPTADATTLIAGDAGEKGNNQDKSSYTSTSSGNEEVLEAIGIGGTKREARHVASAKLLALLFPECETMVEVKAAAEMEREKYAASKASKQHQQNASGSSTCTDAKCGATVTRKDRPYVLPDKSLNSSVPAFLLNDLKSFCLTGEPVTKQSQFDKEAELVRTRQMSRRKQIDEQVDAALHALNEQDEDGKSLPARRELTEDDVGRAVLRKATEDDDWVRIDKLFLSQMRKPAHGVASNKSATAHSGTAEEKELSSPLTIPHAALKSPSSCGTNSIVLLLCRAIAPHEDPPLGCAEMTLGFSMDKGRLLRIAKIANEPHLPQERFLECLENFARCMKCSLVVSEPAISDEAIVSQKELKMIIKAHIDLKDDSRSKVKLPKSRVSSPLQSVREESEVSDASCNDSKREPTSVSKPSKRTRVE